MPSLPAGAAAAFADAWRSASGHIDASVSSGANEALVWNSDPDDDWWTDWYAATEIYDAMTGEVLGSADECQALAGPG